MAMAEGGGIYFRLAIIRCTFVSARFASIQSALHRAFPGQIKEMNFGTYALDVSCLEGRLAMVAWTWTGWTQQFCQN